MIKNLPLLMVMLLIGVSTLIIGLNIHSPEVLKLPILIVSCVLNIWSMLGLILYVGIQKTTKSFSK